ncbi:MAG: PD40 domain-containing protein [Fluviicola sp.]|nr:PD40 domain-containing protein [Fluviicola sp.]
MDSKKRTLLNSKTVLKYNEGVACFSSDLKTMIFTGNDIGDVESGNKINLQLYFLQREQNGNWGEPIPFKYNDNKYSFGHPCLTNDGKTLYFSSNRTGTIGGSDIWKSDLINGEWSEPVNLGNHINTESNELYPFFLEATKSLFFASDGRGGLGGLDIFVASLSGEYVDFAQNLGAPLNSNLDDFSFVSNADISKGYFASNREGGKGKDDIYAFSMISHWIPKKITRTIAGVVSDDEGKPLPNSTISFLVNEKDTLKGVLTDENGFYSAVLEEHLTGKMTIGSIYGKTTESFTFQPDSLYMTKNILFKAPKKTAPLQPFDNVGKSIYFETAKWDLDKQDIAVLQYYVRTMEADTTLKITVSGFADVRNSSEANEYWSKMRMRAAVEFLNSNGISQNRIVGNFYGETSNGIDTNDKKCKCVSSNLEWCRRVDMKLYR